MWTAISPLQITTLLVITCLGLPCAAASGQSPAHEPGVLVRLYDVQQELQFLPQLVEGQLPNAVRVAPTIDLQRDRGDFGELKELFLTEVVGSLRIDHAGVYTFRLLSDDGAQLWINDRLVIDHDGIHGATPKDGQVELTAGTHTLRIWHFQAYGGLQLTLQWRRPRPDEVNEAGSFELIPAALLSHSADAPKETAPGKKKIIPPLRRGRPGDGTPVAGMHPAFGTDGGTPHADGRLRLVGSYVQSAGRLSGPEADLRIWVPDRAADSPDYAPLDLPALLYAGQKQILTDTGELKRVFLDQHGPVQQGAIFRLARPETAAPLTSARNTPVFEILAVRAMQNGLEIEFTKPLDPRVGWDPECYYVEQWPFDLEKGRGPKRDGIVYPVKSASVSPDRRQVFLEIENLRQSHVVYLRLLPPCLSEDGELPWSTEAWYTLNVLPPDRRGTVLTPPAQPPQNILTDAEKAAGWRLLFDGNTTKGWHGYDKDHVPDGWAVRNGCLVRVGPGGDIVTDEEFDNFELKLEWRISAGGNSGIFFRVGEGPPYRWVWETGPEMQVLDNAEHPDGRSPLTSAGSNYALHAPLRDVTRPVGFFNEARIVADGAHIEHWLNGVKIVEYEIGSPDWERLVAESKFAKMPHYGRLNKGRIALQDHGDRVWYRNIKIRVLPPPTH